MNQHTRRIGDLAAGTAVISEKAKYNLTHTILKNIQENYKPYFARNLITQFSDNDMRIVKENMQVALKNSNSILMGKISEKVLSIMNITNHFLQLIDTLLKDYNYYTGNYGF